MSPPINIMLVDDHAVVRAGYRMLLQSTPDIVIVAEAESGEAALELYRQHQIDVVVLDLSLPKISGIEVIKQLCHHDQTARILVFSMHEDVIFVEQAMQAGACGYITKNTMPELLIEAITCVAAGEHYIHADFAKHLAYQRSRDGYPLLSDLSTREFEIFCLLAEGLNTSEIAKRLSLSYKTIANYSTQIKTKLQVSTVAEIARLAIRYDIIKA